MAYIDIIKEKARSDRKTIVLPETTDKRTLIAASHIIQDGIANIIMIGNEEKIMDGAGWLEVDLDGATIIDPSQTEIQRNDTGKGKGCSFKRFSYVRSNDGKGK